MLLTLILTGAALCSEPTPQMEVRGTFLAGEELRVLVDTAQVRRRAGRSGHEALHARGWFVSVDISKPGPLASRGRVLGPLWATEAAQSDLSFTDGVRFTAADVAAGKARPPMGFDDRGGLIRQVRTADDQLIVESGDISKSPLAWSKVADAAPIGQVGDDPYEGRVRSARGRMLVQEEADGKCRAYDLFTGKPRSDPWLTGALADLRARKDFGNTRTWLTDDLNFLVSSPADVHNGENGNFDSFTLDGKTYSRAEYGLVYTRPNPGPTLFKKPESALMFLAKPPHGAVSLGGELRLLDVGDGTLTLRDGEGAPREQWPVHDQPRWDAGGPRSIQADDGRLVLFGVRDPADKAFNDGHVTLVIWDFKPARVRRVTLELTELFDIKDACYEPRSLPGVQNPESAR